MYAKCGELTKAQEIFDALPVHCVVSSNALIAGYAQHGPSEHALHFFECMHFEGLFPNRITFLAILKACGSLGTTGKGKQIHEQIERENLLGKNPSIGTALVDMYAKCGALARAHEVFNRLVIRDVVTWNALLAGYVLHGFGEEALNCYEHMQQDGFIPDAVTFLCILKACGSIGAMDKGKEVHAAIVREGLLEKNFAVGVGLVDMYVKVNALTNAQEVFDKLPVHNVVSWAALLAGYADNGDGKDALISFECMLHEGVAPNDVLFLYALKACGSMGAFDKGRKVHIEIAKARVLEQNISVHHALVDMYAKCGALNLAREFFYMLPVRDVDSWNVLITGYALFGDDDAVFALFCAMIDDYICPNLITFNILLNGCSQSGLIEQAEMYFEAMSTCYGFTPTSEHYTCMVGLYSRAGLVEEALAMLKMMPTSESYLALVAMLGTCEKLGDVKLGRAVFELAVQVDESDAFAYICMSNIYVTGGMEKY